MVERGKEYQRGSLVSARSRGADAEMADGDVDGFPMAWRGCIGHCPGDGFLPHSHGVVVLHGDKLNGIYIGGIVRR